VKINLIINDPTSFRIADKKPSGKSKDEQMAEKKQELEKRLQDVTGQLGASKKNAKKGMYYEMIKPSPLTVDDDDDDATTSP